MVIFLSSHRAMQEHMILSKWDDLIQSLMNFVYVEGRDGDSQVDVYAIRFAANLLILASACVRGSCLLVVDVVCLSTHKHSWNACRGDEA